MHIQFEKKELYSILGAIPALKGNEEMVISLLPHSNDLVQVKIQHPMIHFKFLMSAIIHKKRAIHFSFSSLKKLLEKTRAKYVVELNGAILTQEWGRIGTIEERAPLSFEPKTWTLTPIEMNGKRFSEFAKIVTVFSEKKKIHPWRQQVFLEETPQGFRFLQTNGTHLSEYQWMGKKHGSSFPSIAFWSSHFDIFARLSSFFSNSFFLVSETGIGFYKDDHCQLFLQGMPTNVPLIDFPIPQKETRFYLNPIGKKPFEKVLLEKLREYRNQNYLEYTDIRLNFRETQQDNGYTITAFVSHKNDYIPILSTTSPFFMGDSDMLDLPAYAFVKAMSSFQEVTSLVVTDRGLFIEQAQINEDISHAKIFLHGFAKKKKTVC